jgi:type II secretory pathway component GspD/PulD (secretin)
MSPIRRLMSSVAILSVLSAGWASAHAQQPSNPTVDSITVKFVDADLRAVIQGLAGYLSKPVLTNGIPAVRVTLETPVPVPRSEILPLLQGLVQGQHLQLTEEASFYSIGPVPVAPPPVSPGAAGTAGGPGLGGPVQLNVIRLKHARAADVAGTVNLLFGGSGAFAGAQGLGGGTLSQELRRNLVPSEVVGAAPPVAAPAAGSPPSNFVGQVTIVPDELTNSLLVRASPEDFAVLTQAVDQLDIRPLQVLIEVLIVEARHDASFSFGTSLFMPPQDLKAGGTISGATQGASLGDMVIRLMGVGHAQIDAVLTASQAKGDISIVSRPVLLASNNTEARFLVGTQRPFVQVSRSLPTETPTRDQVIQYRDVGTKLTVRPTINQDGYVSLEIRQEINNTTDEVQFDAPVIATREATTQVLVRDQQTIVIGGLNDEQRTKSRSGVPILSGLPLIGGLFGTVSQKSDRTELFIFLTPRILKTDADIDSVTAPRLPEGGTK